LQISPTIGPPKEEKDIKFMHQSLCNLPISSLLHAIQRGFLNSAPHLNAKMVCKYLMPSPATSKGHMKRPRKGLHSTTIKTKAAQLTTLIGPIPIGQPPMPGLIVNNNDDNSGTSSRGPNLITNGDDESIANIFCFSVFADKNSGVVYNNWTGEFPFHVQ
jgi:hypothetical protein